MITTFLALILSVTDGDTFKARLEVWPGIEVVTAVRVVGMDTPEMKGKCPSEKVAAQAAKVRMTALLASGPVTVTYLNLDKYAGRIDAFVAVNGVNVADTMIKEGLARTYTGGTRASWCP